MGLTPFAVLVTDLNGDGRNDLVTANYDNQAAGVTLSSGSQQQVSLNWSAAADTGGSGVAGYRIYTNAASVPVGTSATPTFVHQGLAPATSYTYRVSAIDQSNPPNESAGSAPMTVTTLGP